MGEDKAVHKELGGSLVRVATIAFSLEAEQDSGDKKPWGILLLKLARVESSSDEEDLGEDASKQGRRINAINADEDITLVNVQNDVDNEMFDVNAFNDSTTATTVIITTEEIGLAQALEALKTSKPKDKGKGIMIEEPVNPMKKKDLIRLDEEVALKLQAEFDEEERLGREKAEKEKEANIALIEE
ncbi:hypothetical protein Tco_0378502 [Tanacetum coccineum]